jgi:hypothetical protein
MYPSPPLPSLQHPPPRILLRRPSSLMCLVRCQWLPSSTASADSRTMLSLLLCLVLPPAVHHHRHFSRHHQHPPISITELCVTIVISSLFVMLSSPIYVVPSPSQFPPSSFFHGYLARSIHHCTLTFTKPTIVAITISVFLPPLPRSV